MNCTRLVILIQFAACAPAFAQTVTGPIALENDYVLVNRNTAPCAMAMTGRCEDRVILAMSDLVLKSSAGERAMKRGQVAVFKAGESYDAPSGTYFEIAVKPDHPPVKSPPELIPPPQNTMVFEGKKFFIYEEQLDPGSTRPRHSHSQRVEIRLNSGPMLHQWVYRDGSVAESEPSVVNWREPITHMVKNIGDLPLRNFILEFLPAR